MNDALQYLPWFLGVIGTAVICFALGEEFQVGQELYFVPLAGVHEVVWIEYVDKSVLWCSDNVIVCRKSLLTLAYTPRPGRCYLSRQDYLEHLADETCGGAF